MTTIAAESARPLDRPALGLLGAGHLSADFCQGALPAMLPFLIAERHLSYVLAAGLVLGQTAASSVVQPVFGRLCDRYPMPWLMGAGLLLAGFGIGLAPLAGPYATTWALIAVGGIGIAAFHPEGARYARDASGSRLTTGMSMFSVGGNLGFALGPFLATPLLVYGGLQAGWALGVIPVVLGLTLLVLRGRVAHEPRPAVQQRDAPGRTPAGAGSDRWGAFGRLTGALVVRSIVFYAFNTFVPLFWIDVLGQSKSAGGLALTLMLLVGAAATLLAGRLGDRFSRRAVVLVGFAALAPLTAAFTLSRQPVAALVLLIPLAVALYLPSTPMVVMGQQYLPRHVGTAAGVTLGLAVSVGGLTTPVVGAAAEAVGLRTALLAVSVLPLIAAAIALTLPPEAPPASRVQRISG